MTSGAKNRLLGLTKELAADWAATKDHWSDAKSLEFEKRFIEDLMTGVNAAMTNIDSLERTLKQIHADCD